jgi:mannosyltransferase
VPFAAAERARPVIAVLAITLVGLVIRMWSLGTAGVWFDESYHLALVREPGVGAMLDAILANPPSDPLYALVLRGWVAVAGDDDAIIRLPSVLAGTLTIPAVAWLANELDGRRAVALLAAAFVALSPYALEFSQEAAPYALAALLTTLGVAAGWRWRRTGRRSDGLLAVALGVGAVYAHYVAVAVLGLAWLVGFTSWSGPASVDRRRWLAAGAVVALGWAPWLVGLAAHWLAAAAPRATLASDLSILDLPRTLAQYVAGTAALLQSQRLLLFAGLGLGVVSVALGWLAGGDPSRRGLRMATLTAAIVFVVPVIAAWLTGAWLFIPHFGLLLLPAGLAVAAAGVLESRRLAGGRLARGRFARGRVAPSWLAGALVAGWCAVSIGGILLFRADPPHGADGLRELVAALEADARPGEPILIAPAILAPSVAQYTDRRLTGIPDDFDLRNIYTPYVRPASDDRLRQATRAAAAGHARVWLVSRPELPPHLVITTELGTTFTERTLMSTEFATLLLFEASTAPPGSGALAPGRSGA